MKWSILLLTWNRLESLKQVVETNIKPLDEKNIDYELLVCDQGSTNKDEVHQYINSLKNLKYFRKNTKNEGTPRAINQLLLRSTGEKIAVMGNDILLPENWAELVDEFFQKVPSHGICGFECATEIAPPYQLPSGYIFHRVISKYRLECVFGDWFFTRDLINDVGAMCELYHPYGLWDSDFNFRTNIAGYTSGYIFGHKSKHTQNDCGQTDDYRKMKNFSLSNGQHNHIFRAKNYKRLGYYYPFPPMKEDI